MEASTEFTQLLPEELFTRTLQLFKIPDEDFIYRGSTMSLHEMPFKKYMHTLFTNIQSKQDPNAFQKLNNFVKLRDHNGLSILGYILLLGKSGGLNNLYSYVKDDKDIQDIISSRLNADLTSVLDYYYLQSKIGDLIDNIKRIKEYVPSFQLSEENAKLIGYRMAKDAFKSEFELRDIRLFPNFAIPDRYVSYDTHTQPPPGHPPPSFYRNGGTRKNHKRHKKQMRKHASKKSKHV